MIESIPQFQSFRTLMRNLIRIRGVTSESGQSTGSVPYEIPDQARDD